MLSLDNINRLTTKKNDIKLLVFKQADKLKLAKWGCHNVSTIHEYQGRQAPHVGIVRLSTCNEEIYNSLPDCLVAISRHTKSFMYIAPSEKIPTHKMDTL